MAYDTTRDTRQSDDRIFREWAVMALVIGSLVGVPLALLLEWEVGFLSTLGVSGPLALGSLAMIPGFALGVVSLVVMLGT